jgi:hypothetical protein
MANPSKLKGTAFETKIVKTLSDALGKEFKRMPLSGAISYLKSDIWLPSDTAAWPFSVECKHYAEIEWNNLLTAKSTEIHDFWRQVYKDATTMNKKPLLIFRWNRSKDFAAYDDFSIECDTYLEVNAFGHKFRIALLSDWLDAYKKKLPKQKE